MSSYRSARHRLVTGSKREYTMIIEEVEIHEFTYEIEDVSPRPDGEIVYVPDGKIEPPGYVPSIFG